MFGTKYTKEISAYVEKQREEREQVRQRLQKELDARMQQIVTAYLWFEYPDIEHAELVPASVALAALVRKQAFFNLMLPGDLSESEQYNLLRYLWESVDGTEFIHDDESFFEQGTHTLDYLERVDDD